MRPSESELLVVDDTLESLRLLVDIFWSQGYKVRPADTPALALESATTNPPDLILLDVNMPGMDGYEVCRRLKRDERTIHIPVIFISALTSLEDRVNGFKAGAVDFISKPIQAEEALARVGVHLQLSWQKRILAEQTEELKTMNDSMMGRELRILELKKEVNELSRALAQSPPYDEAD
jgi:DNA-binding response OmpR family regulator